MICRFRAKREGPNAYGSASQSSTGKSRHKPSPQLSSVKLVANEEVVKNEIEDTAQDCPTFALYHQSNGKREDRLLTTTLEANCEQICLK